MGIIGRKHSLMLANEAPDSFRMAKSSMEHQAQFKFTALVVNESFWDLYMKVCDEESISCNWFQMTWQRAVVEQCDICDITGKGHCTYVGAC